MSDDTKLTLTRLIWKMAPGPDLDKLVALVLFDLKAERCGDGEGSYHLVGAHHFTSMVAPNVHCSSPLPAFSTDWGCFKVVLEWLTQRHAGAEMVFDCGKWSCNVNGADKAGRWFRLASVAGAHGMQEAVCKAALVSAVNPQDLPLEFRTKISDAPVVRRRRRRKP